MKFLLQLGALGYIAKLDPCLVFTCLLKKSKLIYWCFIPFYSEYLEKSDLLHSITLYINSLVTYGKWGAFLLTRDPLHELCIHLNSLEWRIIQKMFIVETVFLHSNKRNISQ